jgi:hypothetical protein
MLCRFTFIAQLLCCIFYCLCYILHEQYFQQAPREQSGGLIQGLLSGLMQRGMNPQQLGLTNTDPYSMSPQMAAQLATYGQQQQPGLLQEVMANPAAKMAIAGLASSAAKQILGNRGSSLGSGLNV